MQPLLDKVATIQALEPPRDINELRQFLGLVGFYRKFIPFFSDITVCLNKMLKKGATFEWTEQHENAFQLLKAELAKLPALQYPNLINSLSYLQMHLNTVTLEFSTKRKKDKQIQMNQS